eukprot:CAMPEP_0172297372 /NCGR_PEP_ID=MMETSP1058-20130122/424_1 /TAXON_ID=83371 /ORGANISM="Detonula confervacea, Strain CCMP 353" /LENGTH=44 /DNA_ID= /DNA_START= /DNA_END= /DNA_ORIENTATION=
MGDNDTRQWRPWRQRRERRATVNRWDVKMSGAMAAALEEGGAAA